MKLYFNASWLMIDSFTKLAVGLLVNIYIIRYLGPSDYGYLSLCLGAVALLYPFATLGTDPILFRDLIQSRNRTKLIMFTGLILRLGLFVTVAIVALFLSIFIVDVSAVRFLFLLFLIVLLIDCAEVYRAYFSAIERVKFIAIAGFLSTLISAIVGVGFVWLELPLIWFAVPYIVQRAVKFFVLRFYFKSQKVLGALSFNKNYGIALASNSWPLAFSSFAGIAYLYFDQFAISYFMSSDDVGVYAGVTKFVIVLSVLPSIVSNVVYPRMIEYSRSFSEPEFELWLESIYFKFLLVGLAFVAGFWFLGDTLINGTLGADYLEGVEVLKVYSVSLVMAFFAATNTKILMIRNLQKVILARNVFGVLLNAILNVILIPSYGLIGAAVATVFSEFLVFMSYSLSKNTRGIFRLQVNALFYPVRKIKASYE